MQHWWLTTFKNIKNQTFDRYCIYIWIWWWWWWIYLFYLFYTISLILCSCHTHSARLSRAVRHWYVGLAHATGSRFRHSPWKHKSIFLMLLFLHSPVPVPFFLSGLHLAAESPDWGSCGTWWCRTKWKARRESFPPSGPANKSPRPESSRPACGVHCQPLCSRTSVM